MNISTYMVLYICMYPHIWLSENILYIVCIMRALRTDCNSLQHTATHCNTQLIYRYHVLKHTYLHILFIYISATGPFALTATHCNAQFIYICGTVKYEYNMYVSCIHICTRALRTDCNTLQRATNIYLI